MISQELDYLSGVSNEALMQELLHRMHNFSKYNLLLEKWNNFDLDEEGYAQHALKIEARTV